MSLSSAAVRAPARPTGRSAPLPGQRSHPRQRPAEPRLRVVAPRVGRSRARLATLCVSLLGAGLVTLLMLTIDLGSGAYTLTQLQRQQRELTEQRQALAEQVEAMQAPQDLAKQAKKLGMVPAPNTTYLQVPSGKVVGIAAAATAPPKPAPKVTSTDTTKSDATSTDKTTAGKGTSKQDAAKQDAAEQEASKQAAKQQTSKQRSAASGAAASTTSTTAGAKRKTAR